MYELLGFNRLSGTSKKNNRPYDFYQLSLGAPYDRQRNPNAVGSEVFTISCDPQTFDSACILPSDIGRRLNVMFDRYGRVAALTCDS